MAEAVAQYKKQDGTISVSDDGNMVSWKPIGAAASSLSIFIADIGNLQQTPATSAKASTKIVVPEGLPQAGNHTFTFTSAAARDDQQTITGLLRKWIEAAKSQSVPTPTPAAGATPAESGGARSASLALAQSTTPAAASDNGGIHDDAKLLSSLDLQMSLLGSDPALRQRFDRALNDKPDSVSLVAFSNQFWSPRVHLLRSHAIAQSQATGRYNVLAVVKAENVDGKMVLNMTKEQIELIFRQHPIVRRAYNENVPPMEEAIFWERFFNSRLRQKLRGEDIKDKVPIDAKLDKYLTHDERADHHDLLASSIPNFINIEANESNHSQKQGNQPDWTMKPGYYEKQKTPGIFQKVPVLKILNRMSEKLMMDVPPSDTSRHAPVGLDEETYKELQLQDLQRTNDDNRVVLMVQDQSRFFSAGQSVHTSTNAATYTKRTPAQVLSTLQQDLTNFGVKRGGEVAIDLHSAIAVDDDSDSEDDDSSHKRSKIGSKTSRNDASSQIMTSVKRRHLYDGGDISTKVIPTHELATRVHVAENILDNLMMTHNTTVEFLHYFWTVYHSGDSDRANEVAKLIETLDRSLDRIKAVADMAELDRAARIEKAKENVEIFNARSARKRKFDPASIQGGAKAINQIVEPLLRAINAARSQYQKALQEQLSVPVPANGM